MSACLSSCLLCFPQFVYSVTSQFISSIYHSWILQSVYLHTSTRQATHRQTSRDLRGETVSKRDGEHKYNGMSISVTKMNSCLLLIILLLPDDPLRTLLILSTSLHTCRSSASVIYVPHMKCLYVIAFDRQQILSYLLKHSTHPPHILL